MAVDKVKPLKMEHSSLGGTEDDAFPTATDPTEDYLAAKGVAFENSDDHLAEKIGEILKFTIPDCSYKPTFHLTGANDGEIDFVEIFKGATQTTINRRLRVDMTYDSSLNPTVEAWKFYDVSDGTTVLRTITVTHTWSGVDLVSSAEVTT